MKRKLSIVILTIAIFTISLKLSAQDKPVPVPNQDSIIKMCLNNMSDMHIGYYGSTQDCKPYNVYAFKYRRNWFLFVSANEKLTFMHVNPPIKDKKINYTSKYFEEGVARNFMVGYTKLVKKRRTVIDMDIYGYYKFNRYGRRVIRGLIYLEYPFYDKGIFKWKIDEEKVKKMAKDEIDSELEPLKLESVKTKIIDQIPIEKK